MHIIGGRRGGSKGSEWKSTLSFRRALNLRRHSTVSCLCIMDATVERCCRIKQELNNFLIYFYVFEKNSMLKGYNIAIFSIVPSWVVEWTLTQTQGCLRACSAVILLAGLIVNIWLIRFFASGVTVSHSGEGNWGKWRNKQVQQLERVAFKRNKKQHMLP